MEDSSEKNAVVVQPAKGKGFRRICAAIIRWLFIILFAVILLGGLYFKAPWKILALDAVLLALLTIVPKSFRKYGWLTLAAAILAVTIWIFLPEKDSGTWRLYTFDEELAELEAKRSVPEENDAAPLYEALFEQWKEIEESDPFPEKTDDEWITVSRPWTANEFPEIAAWLNRHDTFFRDVTEAAKKPSCVFPATVTSFDLSESMDKLSSIRVFCQHLISSSQLDIGEHRSGAWQKQVAVLCLGKHINQQTSMIDVLVGMAIEGMARAAILEMLMNTDELAKLSLGDYRAIVQQIRNSHFDIRQKWPLLVTYEKLFAKNCCGMFYEINSNGRIRFSRLKSFVNLINQIYPNEPISESNLSYWSHVVWKFSRLIFWFSGFPKDPAIISAWIDDAYHDLGNINKTESGELFRKTSETIPPFELNCKYLVYQLSQIVIPSFDLFEKIISEVQTKKIGAELVCDLVYYKLQHSQFPDTLEQLSALHQDEPNLAVDSERFVYKKTEESFVLYHIGSNKIDEKGVSRICEYDPNDGQMKMKTLADDVLIWPKKLEGDN